MKKMITFGMALVLTAVMVGQSMASSIAGKVWYADLTGNDPAPLYGGSLSLDLGETVWLSGMYLTGTYEDIDGIPNVDYDTADAEIILGLTFSLFDIGVGARYSLWTIEDTDFNYKDELAIFGPMAYIGLGQLIGNLPIGWYVGGSYMFKDFGDSDDYDFIDGFEHYNVEGGLFLAIEALRATVGYRIKEYVDYDDLEFKGVAASVGLGF